MDMGCSARMMESKRDLAKYCFDLTDQKKVAWRMLVVANQKKVVSSTMQLLYIANNYIVKVERMKMGQSSYLFSVLTIKDASLTGIVLLLLPLPP